MSALMVATTAKYLSGDVEGYAVDVGLMVVGSEADATWVNKQSAEKRCQVSSATG